MNRMSWMKENAYVTYTKNVSRHKEDDFTTSTTQIGWKIGFLGNKILSLVEFPEIGERPQINIDLTQQIEYNISKGTDSEGNEYIVEYWINPQAKIGELIQLEEDSFFPIEKENVVTIKIGGYKRTCMIVNWEKRIWSGNENGHLYYDKKTGILLEKFQQRNGEDECDNTYSETVNEQINSTNIPELLQNAIPKRCKKCGEVVPENFKFCGNCGEPVKEVKCPKCGEVVPENFKFCGNCGTQIDGDQTKFY